MVRLPLEDRDAQSAGPVVAQGYVMATGRNQSAPSGWTPIPDPTLLTTAALQREIIVVRDLVESKLSTLEEKVNALRSLHDERFHGLDIRLRERDTRRDQLATISEASIMKSEASTTKVIDQIAATLAATMKGINDKIDDVKDRITQIESRGVGSHDTWGSISGSVATVGAIIAAVIAVVAFIFKP